MIFFNSFLIFIVFFKKEKKNPAPFPVKSFQILDEAFFFSGWKNNKWLRKAEKLKDKNVKKK